MSVRDFILCSYWYNSVDSTDKLYIKNFRHDEAHNIAKKFFLEHDYTHFLFLTEDIIVTPEHIRLIEEDIMLHDFPVLCGWSNVDHTSEYANISFYDMRKTNVSFRQQYRHPLIRDIVHGAYGTDFIQVKFQGNVLACYRRDVVEKLSFKPYKYVSHPQYAKCFGQASHGIMFDLQMCNELLDMGIPITCDVRLFAPHFAFGLNVINLKGKKRYIDFYDSVKKEWIRVSELPPYF